MVKTSRVAAAAAAFALGQAAPATVPVKPVNDSGSSSSSSGLVPALPLDGPIDLSSLVFNQVLAGYKKSGPQAYSLAMSKHGGSQEAIAAASKMPVPANPVTNDKAYTCQVKVGSQTFKMDLDTASSDFWLFGAGVTNAASTGHGVYNPSGSAKQQQGSQFRIAYGDNSFASGDVYTDTVQVGDITVQGQAVERATQVSQSFLENQFDGIFGMGFDSINQITPKKASTFFTNAAKQGVKQMLTADLKHNNAGSYTFGDIPKQLIPGAVAYKPVNSTEGFWMFEPDSFSVGGKPAQAQSLKGIADTGTSLLLAPIDIVTAYYKEIPSASKQDGQMLIDCNAKLPDFTLNIGNYKAVVPGDFMNYSPAETKGKCYGGIQEAPGVPYTVYGDIFLKSQMVVFDKENNRIGFAPKVSQ